MARRVILHIGMAKTATSSLQRAFAENLPLLNAHGIAYPLSDRRRASAQHDVIKSFVGGDIAAVDEFFDAHLEKRKEFDRILLSAESMCRLQGDMLRQWKAYLDRRFGNPEFSIWLVIRRLSSWVPSSWQSSIRRGGLDTLPTFTLRALNRLLSDNRLDFERRADEWLAVFPRDSLKIVPMERLIENEQDIVVSTFKRLLDLDAASLRGRYRYNVALTPSEAELLRAVSMRHAMADNGSGPEFARVLLGPLRTGDSLVSDIARILDPWLTTLKISDRCPALLQMERVAAARYADQLERRDDSMIFCDTPATPMAYVQDLYWHDAGIRRRLDEAYEFTCERWKRKVQRKGR